MNTTAFFPPLSPRRPGCIGRFSPLFLILIAIFSTTVLAQSDQTNHRITQGDVNEDASLSLQVPFGNLPGRGMNLPISLSYSSSVWRLEHWRSVKHYYAGYTGYAKQSVTYPIFAEHSAAGWKSSLNVPIIEWPKIRDSYDYRGRPSEHWNFRVSKVTIHMPDGSSHELRESDVPYRGEVDVSGVFYAVDGSRMRYDSVDADTGTLYLPDGTRYVMDGATCQIIDRHGNSMMFDGTNWTDTLGRVVSNPVPSNPEPRDYTYNLPGLAEVNGGVQTYILRWRHLANALTPVGGGTPAMRTIASHYLPSPYAPPSDSDQNNYPQPQPTGTESLFQTANPAYETGEEPQNPVPTIVAGYGQPASQLFNPVVLAEIVLPDGSSYKFGYNVYGEVNKVTYPTGAFDLYDYAATLTEPDEFKQPYSQTERNITSRKQSASGTGSDLRTWTYAESQDRSATKVITITAPDGTRTDILKNNPWVTSDSETLFSPFGLGDSLIGSVIEKRSYASDGSTLLRRELSQYEQSSFEFSYTPPGIEPPSPKELNARRNPRVKRTVGFVFEGPGPALAQSGTFAYDTSFQFTTGADQTGTAAYGYVVVDHQTASSGGLSDVPLGPLVKSSETTYANDAAYRNANILGLPRVAVAKDASQNIVSRSEMVYDECPLYCSAVGKALPTSSKTWDSTKGSDPASPQNQLVTHARFDQHGNRIAAIDAKGNITATTYDPVYQTFPIKVTTAAPDPAPGQNPDGLAHGSPIGFVTETIYDAPSSGPPIGVVMATKDANGQITQMQYNDPLLRPTLVIAPNGHQTVTEYGAGTTAETRWVRVRTQIDDEKWSEAISRYDGLGRTNITEKSNLDGDILIETEYDLMGRPKRSTNPYRATEPKHWTTTEYDDLSRTKKVVTPAADDVRIVYGIATGPVAGTTKTVIDQAGKERTGITDALGNMVRVYEGRIADGLFTDYTFDSQGNLRKTSQGEQSRFFLYDSLGRVLFSKQPEQDTNGNLVATDPITGNVDWSTKHAYDDNGNLTTTTDPRNISITGTYDRLNRLIHRDYSDATPDVSFFYDGTGLGGVPDFSRGKRTKVASAISETRLTSFDSMGRVLESEQRTTTNQLNGTQQPYKFGYEYNKGGVLIGDRYPGGRMVKNSLNADGELERVRSSKLTGSGFATYAERFAYNSAGGVTEMQLGNGRWETSKFNERLQVTEIGLGSTTENSDFLKLEFMYNTPGQADNNGSLREQKINVPGVAANPAFTAVQTYSYDGLNRLRSATEVMNGSQTPSWKQTFAYDRYGNRRFDTEAGGTTTIPTGCTVAVCNPLIDLATNRFSQSGQDYTYDAAGSLTRDAVGQRFLYDAEGKQRAFFNAANQTSTPDATYQYDGDGRRVKKIVGTDVTIFVYDAGGRLAAEYSTMQAPASEARVRYLTTDQLGSPRVITDRDGRVLSRKDFGAFGDEILTPQRTGGPSGNGYDPPGVTEDYTGYERDDESGLEFAQARYYNTAHGRFTSVDPLTASAAIKNPQTFNRYSYAINSPYKFTDPLGLAAQGVASSTGYCSAEYGECSSPVFDLSPPPPDPPSTSKKQDKDKKKQKRKAKSKQKPTPKPPPPPPAPAQPVAIATATQIAFSGTYTIEQTNPDGTVTKVGDIAPGSQAAQLMDAGIGQMATNILAAMEVVDSINAYPRETESSTVSGGLSESRSDTLPGPVLRQLVQDNHALQGNLVAGLEGQEVTINSVAVTLGTAPAANAPSMASSLGLTARSLANRVAHEQWRTRHPGRAVPNAFTQITRQQTIYQNEERRIKEF